jgi:hypothetical protein
LECVESTHYIFAIYFCSLFMCCQNAGGWALVDGCPLSYFWIFMVMVNP